MWATLQKRPDYSLISGVMSSNPPEELAGLISPALWQLSRHGEICRYRKGAVLIEAGGRGERLYVVLSGRLRWFSTNDAGKELTYGECGPGDYLGELCWDGQPQPYSVVVQEGCCCAVIARQNLMRHLTTHPELYVVLLERSFARDRELALLSCQLGLDDVYTRLRRVLETHGPGGKSGASGWVRLTHRDIACRIGCSREMVSRLLKDLEQGGCIRRHPAGIEVLRRLPHRW